MYCQVSLVLAGLSGLLLSEQQNAIFIQAIVQSIMSILQQYRGDLIVSRTLFSSLFPAVSTLVSTSVAYPELFIATFRNSNDSEDGENTDNNKSDNNGNGSAALSQESADKMVLLYVQFLFQGFAVVDEAARGVYLSTIFPLLCSLLLHKNGVTATATGVGVGPVVPLVTVVGKALTSVATSLPDQFRALVGQCGDSEKSALQAAMRAAML